MITIIGKKARLGLGLGLQSHDYDYDYDYRLQSSSDSIDKLFTFSCKHLHSAAI